jgi:hypothetical protein
MWFCSELEFVWDCPQVVSSSECKAGVEYYQSIPWFIRHRCAWLQPHLSIFNCWHSGHDIAQLVLLEKQHQCRKYFLLHFTSFSLLYARDHVLKSSLLFICCFSMTVNYQISTMLITIHNSPPIVMLCDYRKNYCSSLWSRCKILGNWLQWPEFTYFWYSHSQSWVEISISMLGRTQSGILSLHAVNKGGFAVHHSIALRHRQQQ